MDITTTLYSQLFGIIVGSILFGIITVQAMLYAERFPRDPWHIQWVVWLLWYCYIQFISRYRSYFATHTSIAGFIVQLFFLSRYWFEYAGLFNPSVRTISLATLEGELLASKLWFCFSAVTDVMLAAALAIEMRRQHTGYSRTDSMLNRLALYGIATGGVTAAAVVAAVFMTLVAHHYEGFDLIGFPLGGLYITTFLANLHTRSALRTIIHSESLELSATAPHTFGTPRPTNTGVLVASIVIFRRDD
ncbi:hypothetical protein DL93DRAFT_2101496 [Clavulina sp. PMI_390]|nr:hypothetical protein DL93DRAFT_2101496 [Clavulina sp. PMI_390]